MSVLSNITFSYESLPGEPSYFLTSQQATPKEYEVPQVPLSLPRFNQTLEPKKRASNFDISTVSMNTFARVVPARQSHSTTNHHTRHNLVKVSHEQKPRPVMQDSFATSGNKVNAPIEIAVSSSRTSISRSRGLFNDFERASLLSYMQTRSYS
jgi:hypothetical protein